MKFLTIDKTQVIISPVCPLRDPSGPDRAELGRATHYLLDTHGNGDLWSEDDFILASIDYNEGTLRLSHSLRRRLEQAGFEEYNVTVNIPVQVEV